MLWSDVLQCYDTSSRHVAMGVSDHCTSDGCRSVGARHGCNTALTGKASSDGPTTAWSASTQQVGKPSCEQAQVKLTKADS